jgi:hydroxymethylpyrimidine/phosphomethylpyrimidine kinase
MPIRNLTEMERAAHRIHDQGPRYVVVKGGHLDGPPVDVLFDGRTCQYLEGERIETKSLHGTGCSFASAIAAELAKGAEVSAAVRRAKAFITTAIRLAEPIGHGFGPTHHLGALYNQAARYDIVLQLEQAVAALRAGGIAALIPEVGSNLGLALSHATTPQDVAAWEGRIVRVGEVILPVGSPRFGASRHIATIILAVMRVDPTWRSAMNIRYTEDVLQACHAANLRTAVLASQDEPAVRPQGEAFALAAGVAKAIRRMGTVPDIIYDTGDIGKEAMVRVLGHDASDVARKVLLIRSHLISR